MLKASGARSLAGTVRLPMFSEQQNKPEHPDRKIRWAVYMAVLAAFALLGGFAAPLLGPLAFVVAISFGALTALLVNFVRPRYDGAVGGWKSLYDFLLKQMPPPD